MRTLIIFFLAAVTMHARAQVVNIPDSNFKKALIALGVDTNRDSLIQRQEAEAVHSLPLGWKNIEDFTGLKSFINLDSVDCSNNGAFVDLSDMANLVYVRAGSVLSTCKIKLQHCRKLKTLNLSYTEDIDSLDLTTCDSLAVLQMNTAHVKWLDISGLKNIREIAEVDLTIDNLVARNCTGLIKIIHYQDARFGITNSLDVAGCINLETIDLYNSRFTSPLDLSTCPNLKFLKIWPECKTSFINLKNGTSMNTCILTGAGAPGAPGAINICADDFELQNWPNTWLYVYSDEGYSYPYYTHYNSGNYNLYSCYTPNPPGSFNSITGTVQLDTGFNGCDSNDQKMSAVPVNITDSTGNTIITYTAPDGTFGHSYKKGIFTLAPQFPNPYFSVSPATATIQFDTANNITAVNNFCIVPNGVHNDASIQYGSSWPPARPGFAAGYSIFYQNKGNTDLSGTITLHYDPNRVSFASASQTVNTTAPGVLTWSYNNLRPFESRLINLSFTLLPPPINNIGDTLPYLVSITPVAGDETSPDNSYVLSQVIRGSYDPNSKECGEGEKIAITSSGDYLHYTLHFQNEGTDTAFNVAVTDNLNSNYDWNSFEFTGASHPCKVERNNDKLDFYFKNIRLPHKAVNEAASNGYVSFKIKPAAGTQPGDSLNNKAMIYFDYNLPITTNMARTAVMPVSVLNIRLLYFLVNCTGATSTLNWKLTNNTAAATIVVERSIDGIHFKEIHSISADEHRCRLPFSFTDNNAATGKNYYRLKITGAQGVPFYSKIVSTSGNAANGLVIQSITNNAVYLSSVKQQPVQLKVIAGDGRMVYTNNKKIEAGNNILSVSFEGLAKGIYYLLMYPANGSVVTKKFLR